MILFIVVDTDIDWLLLQFKLRKLIFCTLTLRLPLLSSKAHLKLIFKNNNNLITMSNATISKSYIE